MIKFLNMAITCGPDPLHTRPASSFNVPSRRPCSPFSIPQCDRTLPSTSVAPARSRDRLVIPKTTSTSTFSPVRRSCRRRNTRRQASRCPRIPPAKSSAPASASRSGHAPCPPSWPDPGMRRGVRSGGKLQRWPEPFLDRPEYDASSPRTAQAGTQSGPDTFSVPKSAEGASADPRPVLISPGPRPVGRRSPSEACLPGHCESGRPRRGKPHGIAVSPQVGPLSWFGFGLEAKCDLC